MLGRSTENLTTDSVQRKWRVRWPGAGLEGQDNLDTVIRCVLIPRMWRYYSRGRHMLLSELMRPFTIHRLNCPLSAKHGLLLRAALLPKQRANEAWLLWKKNFDLASLDVNSLRLLPLLGRNLTRCGISDPLLEQFENAYRHNSLRNRGLVQDMVNGLKILQRQGIPAMILKGMALALGYYRDIGLRPMYDLDLLVKPADALRAIELLRTNGWRPGINSEAPLDERDIDAGSACHMTNRFGNEIDLHWRTHPHGSLEADARYWTGAEELKALDTPIVVMNPTDTLYFTLIHGLKHRGDNAPRMMADMHTILVKSGPAIQWDRLVRTIEETRAALPTLTLFRHLKNLLFTPVPAAIQNRLYSIRLPGCDRYMFYLINRLPHRMAAALTLPMYIANDCLEMKTRASRLGRRLSVAGYLKARWGLDHMWQAPGSLTARVRLHITAGLLPEKQI